MIITSTDSDYTERLNGIRLLVDNTFDAEDLSDATITNDVFLGEANRAIARRVPNYATLSGDQLSDLKVTTQRQAAVLILQSQLDETSSRVLSLADSRKGMDIAIRIENLTKLIDTTINILNPSDTPEGTAGVGYFDVLPGR